MTPNYALQRTRRKRRAAERKRSPEQTVDKTG